MAQETQAIPAPSPAPMENSNRGLIRIVSPSQVISNEKAAEEKRKAQENQGKEPLLGLSAWIKTAWQAAHNAKQSNIDQRLLSAQRQRKGEYDPDKLAKINQFGGSQVYMMLTNVKCRALESWIREIEIPAGEKPWSIDPTPVPTLPEAEEAEIVEQITMEASTIMLDEGLEAVTPDQIADRMAEIREAVELEKMEKAKKATRNMELSIEDDLKEGNYYKALSQFISDLCTFPTAFMKGPVVRRRKKLVWTEDEEGNWVPAIEVVGKREWCRVSPYNIYPSPGAKSIQDGYMLERHQLRRSDLVAMIGTPGFSTEAIRAVLDDYGRGGLREWLYIDQSRADIENRSQEWDDPDPPIDALEFWGPVQGKLLREWGMSSKDVPDPWKDYQVNAWLIGQWTIMARINPNPLGVRPYYSASFEDVADSIWGKCPANLMADIQEICNGVARALVNNLGISSGPQVEINMDRVAPGTDVEDIYPWKIWKVTSDPNGGRQYAIQFYQPNPMTDMLIKVYEYFFQQSSEQTGIPSYIYGQTNVPGGAGKTASGLSMLMNAASKTMKDVITNIDEGVIKPSIYDFWIHKMLFDDDVDKIGDINIVARASEHLIIAEQLQLRRTEFMEATANPIDMNIIGMKGRAALLREQVKSLKMPAEDIVPSEKDMEIMLNPQQAAPGPVQPGQEGAIPAPVPGGPANIGPAGDVPGEMTRMAA